MVEQPGGRCHTFKLAKLAGDIEITLTAEQHEAYQGLVDRLIKIGGGDDPFDAPKVRDEVEHIGQAIADIGGSEHGCNLMEMAYDDLWEALHLTPEGLSNVWVGIAGWRT
jgi:hypothetical protein